MKNSTNFQFRSLKEEIEGKPAGFHDLLKPHVTIGSVTSSVTSRHEQFHDQVLYHTPFGWLQKSLAIIHSQLKERSKYKGLLDTWIDLTITNSLVAHETYATYLTIKSFPQADEGRLLDRHPPDYQEYFDCLSEVIDGSLRSSYLQFAVGKALLTAAFAGNIYRRVKTLEELRSCVIFKDESPNSRLAVILANFDKHFLTPVCNAIDDCASASSKIGLVPSGFDPYSEIDWMSLERQQSASLDERLIERLHKVVARVVKRKLKLPMFKHDNSKPAASPLFDVFLGLKELDGEVLVSRGERSEEVLQRRRFGDVTIANEGIRKDAALDCIEHYYQLDEHIKANNIAITKQLYGGLEEIDWSLLVFQERGSSVYDLNDDVLVRALNIHRHISYSEPGAATLETLVFGVRSWNAFPTMYEKYEEAVDHADLVAKFDTAFWYMGGSFVDWIDSNLFGAGTRCYILSFAPNGEAAEDLFDRDQDQESWTLKEELFNSAHLPARLFVLRSSASPRYFVRVLPGYESYKIGWKFEHVRFEGEEKKYLRYVSRKILNAIFSTWKRF